MSAADGVHPAGADHTGHAPGFALLDEDQRAELWAALALRHATGIGPRTRKRLLAHFGSAYAAIHAPMRWREAGIAPARSQGITSGAWRSLARVEWDALQRVPGTIILWTDPRYPDLLRQLPDAPVLLYCRGDLSLLANTCVSVVGARQCSREGIRIASSIAGHLARCGVTVVSGLARGIDRFAHEAALRGIGSTIAVLGTGIDVPYPPDNLRLFETLCRTGLVITEFAPGTRPEARHFPIRNRIISGLAHGVLVVEAASRSGSLITARLALEQGREVYAIPGPPSAQISRGCQELIEEGARAVYTAEDVLADLAPVIGADLRDMLPEAGWDDAVDAVDALQVAQVVPAHAAVHPAAVVLPWDDVPHDATLPEAPLPVLLPPPAGDMEAEDVDVASTGAEGAGVRGIGADAGRDTMRAAAPIAAGCVAVAGPLGRAVSEPATHSAGGGALPGGDIDQRLLAALHSCGDAHIDELCRGLGITSAQASSALLVLEVRGKVRRLPGMRYARI